MSRVPEAEVSIGTQARCAVLIHLSVSREVMVK